MYKKTYCRMISLLLIFHVFLFGCAKPPTEDMIRAEKAIESARQKEADIYAADLLRKTEESFQKAKQLVSDRKYEEARLLAIDTVQLAEQAGTVAEVNKEKKRQRIESLQAEGENLRHGVREALEELKLLEKKDFRKREAVKYQKLQEQIPVWEEALVNLRGTADEDGMMQTTDALKKLSDEIKAEKENLQSSLIKKKP